jgi:hypothetical protein
LPEASGKLAFMNIQAVKITTAVFWLVFSSFCMAGEVAPYPQTDKLNGLEIARQVYAVTHGELLRNAASQRNGKEIAMVVNRPPSDRRKPGRQPAVNLFETYGNNAPQNPEYASMQMAIIRSGKARGTGVLYISYTDSARPGQLTLWLPSLRKARRISEPAHEDTWIGTNLTYGEVVLRRPEHEVHERLDDGVLQGCLEAMQLNKWEITRHTRLLPGAQCDHQGKPVYRVRSTTKFDNWWYDYHISEIDRETFALYRTVYYKDDQKIKTVAVDWQSLDQEDPRVGYPRYIYAISHDNGIDSMIYVPRGTVRLNQELPDSFWSERTLKKYGKR